jgi:uncharacterized protein YijF (DUF1287 family)
MERRRHNLACRERVGYPGGSDIGVRHHGGTETLAWNSGSSEWADILNREPGCFWGNLRIVPRLAPLYRARSPLNPKVGWKRLLWGVVLFIFQVQVSTADAISRSDFLRHLVAAAVERTHHSVRYVSEYVRIGYPGGDVPPDTGVCTDEIIRSYRAVGVDLQKEVHEDMVQNFAAYPHNWGRIHPDSNIDHRRVPNLMVFFEHKGETLPTTTRAEDYAPGDLVTWDLGRGVPHIGIVVDQKSSWSGRYMVVHNIGQGPKMEDVLFSWKITGHYRYFGPKL